MTSNLYRVITEDGRVGAFITAGSVEEVHALYVTNGGGQFGIRDVERLSIGFPVEVLDVFC